MRQFGVIVCLDNGEEGPSPLLEPILFDPAATWLAAALKLAGATDFFVICREAQLQAAAPCFPEGTLFAAREECREALVDFLTSCRRAIAVTQPVFVLEPALARLRDGQTALTVKEEAMCRAEDDTPARTGVFEVTAQAQAAIAGGGSLSAALLHHCPQYVDAVDAFLPISLEGIHGIYGTLQTAAKQFSIRRLRDQGLHFIDPYTVYVGPQVQVGAGTDLLPGSILRGKTVIGRDCEIGPNTMIRDCVIGDRVVVNSSQLNESTVEEDTVVGPFAYVRPGCHVGRGVKVGDFVELKNSTIGDGTKISHLTYVGDTDAGAHINFGCGTVTVNYDGKKKFRTTIGDGAFIGCNTNLVAPVTVGEGAYTAAGSTVTEDVPPDALAIARARQENKEDWAKRRRERD